MFRKYERAGDLPDYAHDEADHRHDLHYAHDRPPAPRQRRDPLPIQDDVRYHEDEQGHPQKLVRSFCNERRGHHQHEIDGHERIEHNANYKSSVCFHSMRGCIVNRSSSVLAGRSKHRL